MKLIIDLPEELYKNVVEHTKNGYIGSDVWIAVANGIPLPKRHGRLIDADKILYFRCPNNVLDCPKSYEFTCQHCDYGVASKFRVDEMPTIVEADKENNNG